ncbi:MAG: CDP-glycerol glycerophosphotransferase family protein [Planctomycetes bacterium]|nr:CDP-glycerol glycerophosphotransferase family protein [Planctomycetota bacterium]
MSLSLLGRKRLLCSANNGVCVVMYQPLLRYLEQDDRLKLLHTAYLSHTRRIDKQDTEDLRGFFQRFGITKGVTHYRMTRFMPIDLYLSPNFSERLIPKFAKTKVQMFHGVSFKNCAVSDKTYAFDRLFLPGPYHRRRFLERGLYKDGDPRLVMIGLPKLDRLVDGSIDRFQVLAKLGADPTKKTVLYAPTGDEGNSLHRNGMDILETMLGQDVNFIVKPHDHAMRDKSCGIDWRAKLATWKHPRLFVDLGSDVVPLLAAADILITDASSVAFEYTLLDRPIVFWDVPEIMNGKRAAQMDLSTWGRKGGDIVDSRASLEKTVTRLLDDPSEKSELRQKIANDLFYKPGTAAQRAVRRIYHELDMEPSDAVKHADAALVG